MQPNQLSRRGIPELGATPDNMSPTTTRGYRNTSLFPIPRSLRYLIALMGNELLYTFLILANWKSWSKSSLPTKYLKSNLRAGWGRNLVNMLFMLSIQISHCGRKKSLRESSKYIHVSHHWNGLQRSMMCWDGQMWGQGLVFTKESAGIGLMTEKDSHRIHSLIGIATSQLLNQQESTRITINF